MASGDLGRIESSRLSVFLCVCVSGVCKSRTEIEIKSKRDYCHRENALGIGSGSSWCPSVNAAASKVDC